MQNVAKNKYKDCGSYYVGYTPRKNNEFYIDWEDYFTELKEFMNNIINIQLLNYKTFLYIRSRKNRINILFNKWK